MRPTSWRHRLYTGEEAWLAAGRVNADEGYGPAKRCYSLWEHRRLLYVGCTGDLVRRLGEHTNLKPWWPRVDAVSISDCYRESEALWLEELAIRYGFPLFNIHHHEFAAGARMAATGNEEFALTLIRSIERWPSNRPPFAAHPARFRRTLYFAPGDTAHAIDLVMQDVGRPMARR